MERKLLDELLAWKGYPQRKPLLLDGARQVGKSYLLKYLLGRTYKNVHHIDFLESPQAHKAFELSLSPNDILSSLEVFLGTPIDPTKELLILDEIGECPKAVKSLKFIAERCPTWHVAASGSTIGLLDSFPVGKVSGFTLRPMNFTEFLRATSSEVVVDRFESFDRTLSTHEVLWSHFLEYLFVGGMPEAVAAWKQFELKGEAARKKVRGIQVDIIRGYERDFGKYSGAVNAMHINTVFQNVAETLGQAPDTGAKRYRFSGVIPKRAGYRDFERIIDWLERTQLISKNYILQKPHMPLASQKKASWFKLFYLDVGLLLAALDSSENLINLDELYKGAIVENFVQNEFLSYGLRHTFGWQKNKAELEFLLQSKSSVIPVEVKAGRSSMAKSLRSYVDQYAPSNQLKLTKSAGGTESANGLWTLPLYYCRQGFELVTQD